MTIATLIEGRSPPLSIAPDATVKAAAEIMAGKRIGFLLVVNGDGGLAGVISERDIVGQVAKGVTDFAGMIVADVATVAVQTCTPEDDPHNVFNRMTEGGFRHMPVQSGGRIVGVVSITDLLRHFEHQTHPEVRAEAFKAFFAGAAIPGV